VTLESPGSIGGTKYKVIRLPDNRYLRVKRGEKAAGRPGVSKPVIVEEGTRDDGGNS
jgi:hypothetical protein